MESKFLFIFHIGLILLAANIGGIISRKLKQPAVLGHIIAGILLGAGILTKTQSISEMAEIGVIFLMFLAGLETDVEELKSSGKSSSLIALGGVVLPLLLVGGGTYLMTKDIMQSVFMGIISTATSVSISVQTLREIGKLKTKQGIGILGAAIIDDVVGIILLTVIIGVVNPQSGNSVVIVIAKIAAFFALTFLIGYIFIKLLSKLSAKIHIEDYIITYGIIFCFMMSFLSEELGVAAITGAYFAGVVFSMTTHRHKLSHDIQKISYAMFTPIFFASIGLGVDLGSAAKGLGIGVMMIVLGFIGKILGCGAGAKISGFNKREAIQIGVGMVPRAEVAIIIANLGVAINVISPENLAAVIVMVLVTTLLTPSLLKKTFEEKTQSI